MKCSEEFIKTYAKVLKLIDCCDDKELYKDFCDDIASLFIVDLETEIIKHGIAGAFSYWKETLIAEGGNPSFAIDKSGVLTVIMKECPSLCRLGLNNSNTFYCKHCHLLYPSLFERHGYKCSIMKEGDFGCKIVVSKN